MFSSDLEQVTVSDVKATGEGLGLQSFETKLQFSLTYLQIKFQNQQINICEK